MDCPGSDDRRLRQVGPISSARLAAGCNGRPDAGVGVDSCGHNGDRRPVHADTHERDLSAFADHDAGGGVDWRVHRDLCRNDRDHAKRHQEGPGILHRFATGLYVPGLRRGRVCNRHLSRDDACVLQGPDVPRRGQRDSRHASRTGHASNGRAEEVHALDPSDLFCRVAGDLRHHSVQWLLVERRDSVECSVNQLHSDGMGFLVGRNNRGDVHCLLHDASDGDDFLGQREVSRGPRAQPRA